MTGGEISGAGWNFADKVERFGEGSAGLMPAEIADLDV